MANLFSGAIQTTGEYQKLSEVTGITFSSGTTYTIQIQNMAWIREGETGVGFLINNANPFSYKAGSDDLYIKPNFSCFVNIAD